jgi:hypothetical protein
VLFSDDVRPAREILLSLGLPAANLTAVVVHWGVASRIQPARPRLHAMSAGRRAHLQENTTPSVAVATAPAGD